MASLTPSDNGKTNESPHICQVEEAAECESRPRAPSRKEKGGYECEFVEPPPKLLQSECSICLLVLREPHMISCCGHNFCETCIGRIQRDGKPCPLCNEPGFSTMANKGLKRTLNEFQVRCPHRELGCEWVDELGKLDQHLNANPQLEHQLEGCLFTSVECVHCKDHMRRHVISGHQNEHCPKRPYTCEYCEEYESTFEDVTHHWAECKCYLLPCPNNCHPSGSGIQRQNMEHHVKEECPMIVVECDFHYAGCDVKLPRKDKASHMKEESMAHISLLAAENQRLAKQLLERDEKVQQLMQQNTELGIKIDQQHKAYQDLVSATDQQQGVNQELRQELTQTQDTLQQLAMKVTHTTDQQQRTNQELQKGIIQTKNTLQRAHQQLVTRTAHQQQRTNQELQKGITQTKNTLQRQQRAHQELAEKVTRTTHQQQRTNQELQKGITQTEDSLQQQQRAHQELAEKVTRTTHQQQRTNQELQKGITQTEDSLQQQQRAHQELAEKVTRTTEQQQNEACKLTDEVRGLQQMLHIDMKMTRFRELKDQNYEWKSTPFYTHICGYKMCLCIYANGVGDGKGTHVSVYTGLMCGEFDFDLKWPFQGEITIQLLNQLEDKEHYTDIINFNDETPDECISRVTFGEKSMGWGTHTFIPHSELNFNHAKNCQYLKDDCLIFRVVPVAIQL